MAARLSLFEEFSLRFEKLKAATGNSPRRLLTFYDESREISESADQLQNFLLTTDFERRILFGRKLFLRAPPGFEITWKDYQERWARTLGHVEIRKLLNSFGGRHFGLDPDFDPEAAINEHQKLELARKPLSRTAGEGGTRAEGVGG